MIRCAITEGRTSRRTETVDLRASVLAAAARWAADGIDFIQLREKDLNSGDLLTLAESVLATLRENRRLQPASGTRLLLNSRADVAVAARAHGVHLTSHPDELTPAQVRTLFAGAGLANPVVSLSCHGIEDVERAARDGVDLILFGPVFEKRVAGELITPGLGLEALRLACTVAGRTPVLALGGITARNTPDCLAARAAGIAGIRLFA